MYYHICTSGFQPAKDPGRIFEIFNQIKEHILFIDLPFLGNGRVVARAL